MKLPFSVVFSLHIFISLIFIVLYWLTYKYIEKLETMGCECSVHPYRDYIKYFPIFAIVYLVLMLGLPFLANTLVDTVFQPIFAVMSVVINVGMLLFFIFAFMFVRDLVQKKCACSMDTRRDVLYIWSILELILYALGIVYIIYVFLTTGSLILNLNMNGLENTESAMRNTFARAKKFSKGKFGKRR